MSWKARGLLLFLALGSAGLVVWAFLPQPVAVDVATVTRGSFQQTIDEDGKTRVRERYVVAAPVAGRLLRVTLKAGDPVEAGMPLAVMVASAPALLDVRTEQEAIERVGAAEASRWRTQALVERAQAGLDQATVDLDRTHKLANKGFVSLDRLEHQQTEVRVKTRELQAAQSEDHAAQHQVEMARAALLRLRHDTMDKTPGQHWEVRSPVAGRVLRLLQESEAVVAMGTPLLEIAEPQEVEVVVDVLTADAGDIHPGAPVHLDRGGSAARLEGRVRLVEPAAFTKISALGVEEQRVNVVIDLLSPRTQWPNLGDGHRVEARIVVFRAADVLQIPLSALFRLHDSWGVFTVSNGRATQRPVRIGPRGERTVVVENGIAPGEQVIIYPPDAVRDGVRVKVRSETRKTL